MTNAVIETIKNSWVVGFTQNPTRVNEMEQAIHSVLLSDYYHDIGDYDKITQLTSKIIELAKIHYHTNDWGNAS